MINIETVVVRHSGGVDPALVAHESGLESPFRVLGFTDEHPGAEDIQTAVDGADHVIDLRTEQNKLSVNLARFASEITDTELTDDEARLVLAGYFKGYSERVKSETSDPEQDVTNTIPKKRGRK